MFFEALQAYYAPVVAIILFIWFIHKDTVLEKRVRILFFLESLLILTIIFATWSDRCFSAITTDWGYKIRTATTFLNFALSPLSPLLLQLIYTHKNWSKKTFFMFIPAVTNMILCVASIGTGWIFSISHENVYSRGELFVVPFIVSAFYLLGLIKNAARQEKKKNRKEETYLLSIIAVLVAIASLIEVIFVVRFMLFSTTAICVIMYFMLLSKQKTTFDELTGAYTRTAYAKRLEQIEYKKPCNIALIDINGLKKINDTKGHNIGDRVISSVIDKVENSIDKSARIYRIGGDEFVVIDTKNTTENLIYQLENAQKLSSAKLNLSLSFSFGVCAYDGKSEIETAINTADEMMYLQKNETCNLSIKNICK